MPSEPKVAQGQPVEPRIEVKPVTENPDVEAALSKLGPTGKSMVDDLIKQARSTTGAPIKTEPDQGASKEMFSDIEPEPEAKPEDKTEPSQDKLEQEQKPKPGQPEQQKAGKKSPWKLLDEERKLRLEAEQRAIEAEKRAIPKAEWEAKIKEIEQLRARNQELEDKIRYINYTSSKEFDQKYRQPFRQACERAIKELADIEISLPDGTTRKFAPNDLIELVQMPLAKARVIATEKFGDLANDVMAHRNKLRELLDQQIQAVNDAKKAASERFKQHKEQITKIQEEVVQTWQKANDAVYNDPDIGKWFKPVDGDERINKALENGFAKVDEAFKLNPLDPRLTPEQRRDIVRKHAAIRNRAAAFGRLVEEIRRRDKQIQSLKQQLDQYQKAEPAIEGNTRQATKPQNVRAWDSVISDLTNLAKSR